MTKASKNTCTWPTPGLGGFFMETTACPSWPHSSCARLCVLCWTTCHYFCTTSTLIMPGKFWALAPLRITKPCKELPCTHSRGAGRVRPHTTPLDQQPRLFVHREVYSSRLQLGFAPWMLQLSSYANKLTKSLW